MTMGVGVAALLVSTSAWAAPQGGSAGGKGETGGKGGPGPSSSTTSGAGGSAEQGGNIDVSQQAVGGKSTQNPDVAGAQKTEQKPWEVSATFETHRLIRQSFVAEGLGSVKTFNVLFATAKYDITDNDVITLAGGAYQFFLADSTESGFRATDLSLSYTRYVDLPEKFRLRATGTLTAPVSFDSQLASNITTPSVSAALSRRFGDLLLQFNLRGSYFWDRYTSANCIGCSTNPQDSNSGSGQPNPKWAAGGSFSAEYSMPFHRPLSLGAAISDSYVWYYDVGQCPAGTQCFGATTNPTTDGQPFQQSYGGEVFVRYLIPDLSGFKSDLTLALANGDPTLGYPSVLHDGVVHPYVMYYNSAEVYFAFEGRY
jgi:hypothetical protein